MKIEAYVYKLTEINTGKWYIGSRTAQGCHIKDGYICSSKIVKPLFEKDPSNWKRDILVIGSAEYIRDMETKYLHTLDAANNKMSYNQCNMWSTFSTAGKPVSQETRDKISRKAKGRKHTEETKAKISNSNNGRKVSDETRIRISKANKGKKVSQETRNKLSKAGMGRKVSDETRIRISKANQGKKVSQEGRDRIKKAKQNITDETRAKLREAKQNITDETRAKMREAAHTRPKFQCPHCNKYVQKCHLIMWHGDKCKEKTI